MDVLRQTYVMMVNDLLIDVDQLIRSTISVCRNIC